MSTKCVVGIDPGLRGAVVCLGWGAPRGWKLPIVQGPNANKIINCLELGSLIDAMPGHALFYVEQPFVLPGQGLRSAATTYENFGRILACLESSERPYGLIRPQEWQGRIAELTGLPKVKDVKPKLQARVWVKHLPEITLVEWLRGPAPHDGLVDAYLIAKSQAA